jgi:hypothetical protein
MNLRGVGVVISVKMSMFQQLWVEIAGSLRDRKREADSPLINSSLSPMENIQPNILFSENVSTLLTLTYLLSCS